METTTAANTIRITTRYGAGTFVLEIGGRVVGCVTRIFGLSSAWLCDSARGGGWQTLPVHEGGLLSALRFVMESR
jgi:hypothetical protein